MRRLFLFLGALMLAFTTQARPVDVTSAQKVGMRFLLANGLIETNDTLALSVTFVSDKLGTNCFYVFNVNDGFVIVSADTRSVPILGYSFNGNFVRENLPGNMEEWLEGYRTEIERGIAANAPEDGLASSQWKRLLDGSYTGLPDAKDDDFLVTSQWEQGSGYNMYCPVWNGEHVVVGCVATAMAQIIRYWQYPTRGFGQSRYVHSHYGQQAVNFDTVDYNYSLMPDKIRRTTSNAQRQMVSHLCYHCGITVKMNYQNPDHTTGSGAHSRDVPDALKHFGYVEAVLYERDRTNNDDLWDSLIRVEIDARRPIYYSGSGPDGGHAFILDGYDNQHRYHFNWGWGGYCDGFYTLTTMQGFTLGHEMVINIKPSGWDGHLSRFYISPDGNGGGVSWAQANNNIHAAWVLSSLVGKDLWMKEGVYYGDTMAAYAFSFSGHGNVYGGFAGTETALSQRNVQQHPTILSGRGRQQVLSAKFSSSGTLKLSDITVADGYSHAGSCVLLSGESVQADGLTIRDCVSDSGVVADITGSLVRYTQVKGNTAPVICHLSSARMRQSLVNNNDGDAVYLTSRARLVNSTIASNAGSGVVMDGQYNTCLNTIVWNNDTNVGLLTEVSDTSFGNCAIVGDSNLFDSLTVVLNQDNMAENGPRFIAPSEGRGVSGLSGNEDWHLSKGSVCINAGKRLTESMQDGDMERKVRCRQGFIDIGCYESNYNESSIEGALVDQVRIYPNPASDKVTISGFRPGMVEVYDVAGCKVRETRVSVDTATIGLDGLPAGVYFVRMQELVYKLVKR